MVAPLSFSLALHLAALFSPVIPPLPRPLSLPPPIATAALQGAIILGIGGDNSNRAIGTFYEGAIVQGIPSSETDQAVQANIVAAGYGKK